jgi:hypothetical protein
MAYPEPSNVAPWYLRNINQALALDEASGNVFLRTGFEGNIIITGNVEIPGTVTVNSSPEDPVHVHLDEVGTSGILDVPYLPIGGNVVVTSGNINANVTGSNVGLTGNLAGITGNVNIGTIPAITGNVNANITGGNVNAAVTGTVTVSNISSNVTVVDGGGSLTIDGNVGVTGNVNIGTMPNVNAAVTGTVAVSSVTGNVAGITANVTVVDGGGSLTIDGNVGVTGNVNIGTMPAITGNVNANITGGNVTVTQGTNPWVVSGNVNTTITGGNSNVAITGTNLDAFGRLRVSEPYTLFDSQNRYIDGDQFSNITATGGNVVYVQNESSFNLNVSATSGSSVIRQSKTVQAYQPGKSLLVMNTFAMATLKANLRQRVGYFTTDNGVYFEAVGTTLNLVIRSSTTGVVVEERIAQASWNGNTLLSGIVLDPTLTQIFWCDIEWLGVGNVRVGFVINGQFIVCHTFQHANQPGNTTVYMTTASLNPRYEITNTGATTGNSTMKQICSTVISEGGYTPSTKIGYVNNGTSTTRVSAANTVTSLCSIRLNPAYPDAVVVPAQIDLLLIDVRYGQFQLIENATFTTSWSNVAGSVVQSAIHSNTITDGTVVYAGLTSSRDAVEISEDVKKRIQLWRDASGTPSTLTLAVSYTQANSDLLWKLGWEELTN